MKRTAFVVHPIHKSISPGRHDVEWHHQHLWSGGGIWSHLSRGFCGSSKRADVCCVQLNVYFHRNPRDSVLFYLGRAFTAYVNGSLHTDCIKVGFSTHWPSRNWRWVFKPVTEKTASLCLQRWSGNVYKRINMRVNGSYWLRGWGRELSWHCSDPGFEVSHQAVQMISPICTKRA